MSLFTLTLYVPVYPTWEGELLWDIQRFSSTTETVGYLQPVAPTSLIPAFWYVVMPEKVIKTRITGGVTEMTFVGGTVLRRHHATGSRVTSALPVPPHSESLDKACDTVFWVGSALAIAYGIYRGLRG